MSSELNDFKKYKTNLQNYQNLEAEIEWDDKMFDLRVAIESAMEKKRSTPPEPQNPLLEAIDDPLTANPNNNTFRRFCNFDALYNSSYRVCRNVRWKDSTINFEERRLSYVCKLMQALEQEQYKQLPFSAFSIIERGKPRDIRACHIQDRHLQNALCENVLIPLIAPTLEYDNCATLKNKGIDFALERFKTHFRDANQEYGRSNEFYCLRIDISKYFDEISHDYLKKIISKYPLDEPTKKLAYYIVDTFNYKATKDKTPVPGKQYYVYKNGTDYIPVTNMKGFKKKKTYFEYSDKSLGLGSQASQLLALLTLNTLDHFIKDKLRIKYYGRYMDDFYLLHNDKEYLQYCLIEITKHLEGCHLRVNPKKTIISKIKPIPNSKHHYPGRKVRKGQPIKYLKWDFYITDTGAIIQLPFRSKISKQRRKLRKMQKCWLEGKTSIEDIITSYEGWRTHISKGTTYYLLKKMDKFFFDLFKEANLSHDVLISK